MCLPLEMRTHGTNGNYRMREISSQAQCSFVCTRQIKMKWLHLLYYRPYESFFHLVVATYSKHHSLNGTYVSPWFHGEFSYPEARSNTSIA